MSSTLTHCPEFVDTPLVTTNLEFFSKKSQDHIKSVGLMRYVWLMRNLM